MRTAATRIGRTVPIEFEGTVRAVWSRACALAPDAHAGPALITLVRDDVPMTAASIALGLGTAFDFATSGVTVGDRVISDGATLVVHRARPHEPIEANLLGATRFDGLVPEMPERPDSALLAPVEDAARRHRAALCGRSAFGVASSVACDTLLERLTRRACEDDAPAVAQAAHSLVGLGPGLSPAGDDVLCGFMLGRRLAGRGSGDADAAIARVALGASGVTSDVSAVQLELAARGRFGEALLHVASALGSGRARILSAAVARCLAEGSTSGADGLLGLVAGVRAGQTDEVDALVRS